MPENRISPSGGDRTSATVSRTCDHAICGQLFELYTDLNEVLKATPEGIDKEFLGKALAHLSTGALLLKATTDVFKAQHDIVNQMKGNTQC